MKVFWTLLAVVTIALTGMIFWVDAAINQAVTSPSQAALNEPPTVHFVIKKGEGVKVIGQNLAKAKLISSPLAWEIYLFTSGRKADLLPGNYQVKSTMTARDIAQLLTSNVNPLHEMTVKIPEGATAAEIGALLEKNKVIAAKDFLAAADVKDSRAIVQDHYYEFLTDKPSTAGMEGFLFPDTYRFFQAATPTSVLRKFLDNFDVKLKPETRQQIKASGRTYYQTVIMASIVEAELRTDVDRAMAADIFWRRLDAGMALQADTTVIYAYGGGKTKLTNADLQIDSPYNTYKYPGLPPGPIGNPGLSALRAAANPTPNEYWYYLSGTDGKTHYAKTLDEHNRNKQLYL